MKHVQKATCVDCESTYCIYRNSVHEWVCTKCWHNRGEI